MERGTNIENKQEKKKTKKQIPQIQSFWCRITYDGRTAIMSSLALKADLLWKIPKVKISFWCPENHLFIKDS